MAENLRALTPERLEAFKPALSERASKCFLCAWTLRDLQTNGKLTGWPGNMNLEAPIFPVRAKLAHLWLEFVTPKTGQGITVEKIVDGKVLTLL